MKLPKHVLDLMGKKVKYCRAKQKEDGTTELFKGAGFITGIIIGASKRVQILIQDNDENKDKAWTLDPMCIDATDEEAKAYFEHHLRLKKIVEDHNAAQRVREQEKIAEVDLINAELFGKPLEL